MTQDTQLVIKQGYCQKLGAIWKTWKKRWFVLKGNSLYYYTSEDLSVLKGVVELSRECSVFKFPECKKQPAFCLDTTKRKYLIVPSTEAEVDDWISCISNVIMILPPSQSTNQVDITLDNFQPLKVLGKGSYGKVTLVRIKGGNKLYALKSLSKQILQQYNTVEKTILERNTLMILHHPFLVKAEYAFQNDTHIFLALEYVPGGELFSLLAKFEIIPEEEAKKYIAMLLLAIGEIHSHNIMHRDLKPENIMVDADGYLKITDFGLVRISKINETNTATFCGSPEYMAPEMVSNSKYGQSVDWWALGIIGFKMLFGYSPFLAPNDNITFNDIINKDAEFPEDTSVSMEGQDFINQLLIKETEQRLGCRGRDYVELQQHPWFKDFPWDDLLQRKLAMAYVPAIETETDTSNFDSEFTGQSTAFSYVDTNQIDAETQRQLSSFTLQNTSIMDNV